MIDKHFKSEGKQGKSLLAICCGVGREVEIWKDKVSTISLHDFDA